MQPPNSPCVELNTLTKRGRKVKKQDLENFISKGEFFFFYKNLVLLLCCPSLSLLPIHNKVANVLSFFRWTLCSWAPIMCVCSDRLCTATLAPERHNADFPSFLNISWHGYHRAGEREERTRGVEGHNASWSSFSPKAQSLSV